MSEQKQNEQSNRESEQSVPAFATLSQVRQSDIYAMSYKELDVFVDGGVNFIDLHQKNVSEVRRALRPAILRVHDALSCQGRRTDLLDAPAELTFDTWVRNKAGLGSRATIYRLLADAGMPRRKPLAEGAKVRFAKTGEAGVVTHRHEQDGGVPKVDVLFEGEKKAVTCVAEKLVKVTVLRVAVRDLIIAEDTGAEFRYEGGGKFVPTAAPLKVGQQRKMCRTAKCAKVKACRTMKAVQVKAAAAGQRI